MSEWTLKRSGGVFAVEHIELSTRGINWWKSSRLIEKALSRSQWRRPLASWTLTWSLFHVLIISSKHFIKSSLCSNTIEIILLWKFVCSDRGILVATQSSRHDTLFGEQEKNTENEFRFAKKTLTLVICEQDWVGGHSNEHNEHWDMLPLLSSEHLYVATNTWCTKIKLHNKVLFVMSLRKNERVQYQLLSQVLN